jgi:hypothetical protein
VPASPKRQDALDVAVSADRGNVVLAFRERPGVLPDNPLELEPGRRGWCRHPAIRLDEHDRTVQCRKCGAMLDAFGLLVNNARTLQTAWSSYRIATAKAEEVERRVHALQKEEATLRAQVQLLRGRSDDVIDFRRPDSL